MNGHFFSIEFVLELQSDKFSSGSRNIRGGEEQETWNLNIETYLLPSCPPDPPLEDSFLQIILHRIYTEIILFGTLSYIYITSNTTTILNNIY